MLMEAVKGAVSDTLVAKSTQYVVPKYTVAIILFYSIHTGLG
jgi:hypothetical protein